MIDEQLLRSISGGDTASRRDVLSEFLESLAQDTEVLRRSSLQGDFNQVILTSHRMRGACLLVGAVHLAQELAELEAAARSRSIVECESALVVVSVEHSELDRHIRELLNTV